MAHPVGPSKIFLNSDHRNPNDSADSFTINLETILEKPKSIMLRSCTVPLTCHPIQPFEGVFYWYFSDAPTALRSLVININRVFLNPVELINEFNLSATNAGISLRATFDPDSTASSYPGDYATSMRSYRVTLTASTPFRLPGWNESVWDGQVNRSMYWNLNQRMGFCNTYSTSLVTSLTADSPPMLARTSTIHVRADVGSDSLTSPMFGGTGLRDILASIPITQKFGDIVVYKEFLESGRIVNHLASNVKSITIQLLDAEYQPLGLPANATSTFEFDITY